MILDIHSLGLDLALVRPLHKDLVVMGVPLPLDLKGMVALLIFLNSLVVVLLRHVHLHRRRVREVSAATIAP